MCTTVLCGIPMGRAPYSTLRARVQALGRALSRTVPTTRESSAECISTRTTRFTASCVSHGEPAPKALEATRARNNASSLSRPMALTRLNQIQCDANWEGYHETKTLARPARGKTRAHLSRVKRQEIIRYRFRTPPASVDSFCSDA